MRPVRNRRDDVCVSHRDIINHVTELFLRTLQHGF